MSFTKAETSPEKFYQLTIPERDCTIGVSMVMQILGSVHTDFGVEWREYPPVLRGYSSAERHHLLF